MQLKSSLVTNCVQTCSLISIYQPKRVKFTKSVVFVCPIPILACKQCIFLRFKVYKFSLGLCYNNQVKEKQWKWSIVIPYDVYQQQVPPPPPPPKKKKKKKKCQKCYLIVIVRNFKNVLCSNGCFISSFQLYFIDTHIYLSFNFPHLIEK